MSCCFHHVPGRLRIKTPLISGCPDKARGLETMIQTISGVDAVAVNDLTGSVVIKYDRHAVNGEKIVEILKKKNLFDLSDVKPQDESFWDDKLSTIWSMASKALIGLIIDYLFEGTPLSLLSVLI